MTTLDHVRAAQAAGATRFGLSSGLTAFPPEIFALADTLEILDLSGNALTSLPPDLPRLRKLRILFCSNNHFTELPAVLGQCPQLEMVGFRANHIAHVPAAALPPRLRWLTLTDNHLTTLPAEIGRCTRLQKLMLAGNRLQALPPALAHCTQLELLRVAANQLADLPGWLLALPRLSWLAFAGNPFARAAEGAARAQASSTPIAWGNVQLQQLLGEGASGHIYQALWQRGAGRQQPVAVKLFKGAITSDGLPQSEMTACLAAGAHPGLIAVQGHITGHPAGASGLVMDLVDPRFANLAGPPSLDSCTRDVYASGERFGLAAVLRMARTIASALRQLHARGMVHGDVYGHNMLRSPEGEALLGDFGAASFAEAGNTAQAQALARIEVRAFGHLLEELLARCDAVGPDARLVHEALVGLQRRCLGLAAAERPLFGEIEAALLACRLG